MLVILCFNSLLIDRIFSILVNCDSFYYLGKLNESKLTLFLEMKSLSISSVVYSTELTGTAGITEQNACYVKMK